MPHKDMKGSQNFQDLIVDIAKGRRGIVWKKLSDRLKKNGGFLKDKFYLDCLKKL